jgi:hypothetical protein
MSAGLFDKTFVLLGVICIIWRGIEMRKDNSGYNHPFFRIIRIYVFSTLAMVVPLGIVAT